jgi:glycine/serine hydroxymethyltransferase
MKEEDMTVIASLIHRVLADLKNEEVEREVNADVRKLTDRFPLYAGRLTSGAK